MVYGLIAGMCVILASVFGSALGLIFKKISHKLNDTILGFAAGVMLAAAFLGLLPTALEGGGFLKILLAIAGVLIGALFISLIDRFVPHIHFDNGQMKQSETKSTKNRTLLLIIAIAIHNIPEGLATGIVFGNGITDSALLVATSMIIQKIPEGLIVIVPLLGLGMSKAKAFRIALIVSAMMIPGVVIGTVLGSLPVLLTAFFYAFTFGAIIYVISDEIIPESHEHGFQRAATFALLVGVLTVAVIEFI